MNSGRCSSAAAGAVDVGGITPAGYRPRAPEHGALHRLVHEHLETFLAEAGARGDGTGLPRFVEREMRGWSAHLTQPERFRPADPWEAVAGEFLTCGQLARGFEVPIRVL